MLAIIGTYRKGAYVPDLLASMKEHVTGIDRIVFVDDSGDPENSEWLRRYGEVVETGAQGYGPAMRAICTEGAREPFAAVIEEDFTFTANVDFTELQNMLEARPHLAQIALLRQAWFPVEKRAGGVLQALRRKGHRFRDVDGLLEHTATFTCNPSVWPQHVFATGWPDVAWSEDAKRDELLAAGYRFAYLPSVRTNHAGVRSGKGY